MSPVEAAATIAQAVGWVLLAVVGGVAAVVIVDELAGVDVVELEVDEAP